MALRNPRFSWGSGLEVTTDGLRSTYRQALQRADRGTIDDLLTFARA